MLNETVSDGLAETHLVGQNASISLRSTLFLDLKLPTDHGPINLVDQDKGRRSRRINKCYL